MNDQKVLVVIPARGGSKSIPRKNLRPLLGIPLIDYSISTAAGSRYKPLIYVSTDDPEIANRAKHLKCNVLIRPPFLSNDETTLDPVIWAALAEIKAREQCSFDVVVTLQPTSPLLTVKSLDEAIESILVDDTIDTVISAKEFRHLTWRSTNQQLVPNYESRENRQFLSPIYCETGGFLITRERFLSTNNRIGRNVKLHILKESEAVDIDSPHDWSLCEFYLKRKTILFVVTGNKTLGLGHVYNTLSIANELPQHDIKFLVDSTSQLAFEKISTMNYKVYQQTSELVDDIQKINPDLVINDILNTDLAYMVFLKKNKFKTVNFEDLGPGAKLADIVFNAMYPHSISKRRHFSGPAYFIPRSEFISPGRSTFNSSVQRVVITFGGVDPNNFTEKVLRAIYHFCIQSNIQISVICGFGYHKHASLTEFNGVTVYRDVSNIAELMRSSDVAFTSAGRTIYEVACLQIPAIVLCQNEREVTHFFASEENGYVNLGMGENISATVILDAFKRLIEKPEIRQDMIDRMRKHNFATNAKRVITKINALMY